MRIVVRLLISLLMSFVAFSSIADTKRLVFYGVNFPPYEIEFPVYKNRPGFDVEVVTESFKRVGISAEVKFLPWKRLMEMAREGQIAGAVTCTASKLREPYFYFSDTLSFGTRSFAVTSKYRGPEITSLAQARGLDILVVSGYAAESELRDAELPYNAAMSDETAINRLLKRPYDVFYTAREFMQFYSKKMGIAEEFRYFDIAQKSFRLCISKKWPNAKKIKDAFNTGLADVKADGTYEQIHNKYR